MEWSIENINEIVIYINNELSNGKTMSKIEKDSFNLNPGVINKRLIRLGYVKVNNQYILEDEKRLNNTKVSKDKCYNKSITLDTKLECNDIEYKMLLDKYKELDELIPMIKPLKDLLNEYKNTKTIMNIKPVVDVRQKNFKVDKNLLERWEMFVLRHKEYKAQQLISLAIEEFLDRYDKE